MSKQLTLHQKLFILQQEIGTISKDAKNPFYKSKYFDINSLIKQLQPLFKENRLVLYQPILGDSVETTIKCIDTEQSVISNLKLPEISDPQKLGSAITYYRRYTLASLLGLQAVDDDGNLGSGKVESQVEKKWLNENTPEFSKAIEYIQQGGNVEDIKSKYKVSKKVQDALSKL
jgi:hypothetical protein